MRNVFLLFIVCGLFAFNNIKLKKVKVSDGITVMIPKTFYPMAPEDIVQRFPSVRKPIAAYTNEDRLIDFSVKISATQWRQRDIPMMKEFFKASIINLYDKVDLIQEGIIEVNGRQFVVFEFDSYIAGNKYSLQQTSPIRKYSYVQYTIVNGQTIVFSFNAPNQSKDKWKEAVGKMMSSIKIKG